MNIRVVFPLIYEKIIKFYVLFINKGNFSFYFDYISLNFYNKRILFLYFGGFPSAYDTQNLLLSLQAHALMPVSNSFTTKFFQDGNSDFGCFSITTAFLCFIKQSQQNGPNRLLFIFRNQANITALFPPIFYILRYRRFV